MRRTLTDIIRLLRAVLPELRQPGIWTPACVLLLPTLALQLAFPHYLRTRLSPSMWTVVAGSLCIVWLTQTAAAASWGWVDARRHGRKVRWPRLASAAVQVGTCTTAGLLAGGVPGLYLQARLAYRALQRGAECRAPRPAERRTLMTLATIGLLVSVLGQSLAAGLAEAMGTIVPSGVVDGRVRFTLQYTPHLATSVLAYGWTAFALTLQAVGVSIACADATSAREPQRVGYSPALRAAAVGAGLAMVLGVLAAMQKLHQHLY